MTENEITIDSPSTDISVQPDNIPVVTDPSSSFMIPDEYKEAGWSKNIKSYNDLWKMNANAQELVGKKTIGIPTEKSTDEEWNEYYAKLRPTKAEDYGLELEGADKEVFEELFYNNGINTKQAAALVKGYKESVEKASETLFSEEGYKKELAVRFGDGYDVKVKNVNDFIRREANESDRAVLDKMPNNVLGIVYSLIDKVQTRYAVKDTDTAQYGGNKNYGVPDWQNYTKEAEKLKSHSHTMADIEALKEKFNIK